MSRVAVLHHDLEKSEQVMVDDFRSMGISLDLFDVRTVQAHDMVPYSLVLNRVYASVATRDLLSLLRCQSIVQQLEEMGKKCVNGSRATHADYDKYFSYQLMKDANVPTPATELMRRDSLESMKADIQAFAGKHGFPVIVKRNSSGRGVGLYKIDQLYQADAVVQEITEDDYTGHWIMQAFVKSVRPYDWRPYVVCGKVAHSATRSLIKVSMDDSYPWLGSVARGSEWASVPATDDEMHVALRAAEAIGAEINTPDIVFGENGPVIIENNPTPRFFETEGKPDVRYQGFLEVFAPYVIDYLKNFPSN